MARDFEALVPARAVRLTMVKKIMADGRPCRKCAQVEQRLREQGYAGRIDRILVADERAPDSPGMRLARCLNVVEAPFFVMETEHGEHVYTSYLKLVREVFRGRPSEAAEARELLEKTPGLDYI